MKWSGGNLEEENFYALQCSRAQPRKLFLVRTQPVKVMTPSVDCSLLNFLFSLCQGSVLLPLLHRDFHVAHHGFGPKIAIVCCPE